MMATGNRRVLVWLCCAYSVIAGGCGAAVRDRSVTQAGNAAALGGHPGRMERLLSIIAAPRSRLHTRAVQELEPFINTTPGVCDTLLKHTLSYDDYYQAGTCLWAVLGTARGEAARAVLRAYKNGTPDARFVLLLALARIGPELPGTADTLREDLKAWRADGENAVPAVFIEVVLASLGKDADERKDRLARIIEAGDFAGREILQTMSLIGRNDWIDGKIRATVLKAIENKSEVCGIDSGAALVLGTLGPGADEEVRNALRRFFDRSMGAADTQSLDYMVSGLALAQVEPTHARELLRAVLKRHRTVGWERHSVDIVRLFCADARDGRFQKGLIDLLSDSDAGVVIDAAYMLSLIGVWAGDAVPQLLWVLESSTNDDAKRAAARAIGAVGDPSCVEQLRVLGQRFGSNEALKKVINRSIADILLQE